MDYHLYYNNISIFVSLGAFKYSISMFSHILGPPPLASAFLDQTDNTALFGDIILEQKAPSSMTIYTTFHFLNHAFYQHKEEVHD